MKIAFITDSHITARAPASRLDNVEETILNKFIELGAVILKEKIDIVLHGGDMFHRPDVSNKFAGDIAKLIKSYNVPFYVVPGNHDVTGQNEYNLPYSKLGLLSNTGIIKILDRKNPIEFNDNGYIISVEGQEYYPDIDKNPDSDYAVHNTNADYKILVAHSMLLENTFYENVAYTLIKDVKTDADLVLTGHYHPGFKEKEINGTKFYNPGSMFRVEASNYSINNKPKMLIIDIEKNKEDISYYEFKIAKEGKEVFSNKNLINNLYNSNLDNFNNKLKNIKIDNVNIVNLINEYAKNNTNKDITTEIIDKAKTEISNIQKEQSVDNGFVPSLDSVTIDKVEITNFQVHESRTVEFKSGLNSITGSSSVGKTSIIRAIVWALYNKPTGSAFITTGKKSCCVKVYLSNGYTIIRKRNHSNAGSYELIKPDGTKEVFKGFSNDVPIEIINAHQMPEIKINGVSYMLNISEQLESSFMVTSSSPEKMAMIGSLVDADRADAARRNIILEKRNLNANLKKIEELKLEQENVLEKYSNLSKLKSKVELLEMADEKLELDIEKLDNIKEIKSIHENCLSNLNFINNSLNNLVLIDKLDIDKYKDLLKYIEDITNLFNSYNLYTAKLNDCDKLLSLAVCNVDEKDIILYKNLLTSLDNISNIKESFDDLLPKLKFINYRLKEIDKNFIDSNFINDYKQNINNLSLQKELLEQYDKLSNVDFSFNYDLDAIKTVREEYVELVKTSVNMSNLSLEYINKSKAEDEFNQNLLKIEAEIESNIKLKEDKLKHLSNETHICELCGSEVTVDKLIKTN